MYAEDKEHRGPFRQGTGCGICLGFRPAMPRYSFHYRNLRFSPHTVFVSEKMKLVESRNPDAIPKSKFFLATIRRL
jgi:hypothetical protein